LIVERWTARRHLATHAEEVNAGLLSFLGEKIGNWQQEVG